MDQSLVSILIPCFNSETWIAQCIDSALAQTHPHKEVIVLDDGSTDGSAEVIRGYDGRVLYELGPNRGGNAARHRLTELARGHWLQYLDSDDYLLPQKIEHQIEFAAQHQNLDVVYSPVIPFNELTRERIPQLALFPDDDHIANYFRWGAYNTNGLLFRRSAVLEVGSWKLGQPCCQEHELLLRLIKAGKSFAWFDRAEVMYRFHGNQTVSRKDTSKVDRMRMALTDDLEAWLVQTGRMNSRYRQRINQARFDVARATHWRDRAYANALVKKITDAGQPFTPMRRTAPWPYPLLLRALGFDRTERWLGVYRKLRGRG